MKWCLSCHLFCIYYIPIMTDEHTTMPQSYKRVHINRYSHLVTFDLLIQVLACHLARAWKSYSRIRVLKASSRSKVYVHLSTLGVRVSGKQIRRILIDETRTHSSSSLGSLGAGSGSRVAVARIGKCVGVATMMPLWCTVRHLKVYLMTSSIT